LGGFTLTNVAGERLRAGGCILCCMLLFASSRLFARELSIREIIQKSVAVNAADFKAATRFAWIETDNSGKGSKKYRVTMIAGTPYYRLIELNGNPLSKEQDAQQARKEQQVIARRKSESPEQRNKRIGEFEKERKRNNAMMQQMTEAFNFTMVGTRQVHGYSVYVLQATPRPGYKPPTMETQVLAGMHGELWIEQNGFHWVKVTAQVIHPVSIEGFLAEVEPGTQFELDQEPVGDGSVWQPSHFSMKSNARVFHLFPRESADEETYTDYTPVSAGQAKSAQGLRP
jgi:hypothetical protein